MKHIDLYDLLSGRVLEFVQVFFLDCSAFLFALMTLTRILEEGPVLPFCSLSTGQMDRLGRKEEMRRRQSMTQDQHICRWPIGTCRNFY